MGQAGCKVSGVSRKLDRIQSGVFGASGDMSRADIAYGLDEAGQRAIEKLQDIREGIDPQAEKVADRNALTVPELTDLYLEEAPALKPNKKETSWGTNRIKHDSHIKLLIGRHLAHAAGRTAASPWLRFYLATHGARRSRPW